MGCSFSRRLVAPRGEVLSSAADVACRRKEAVSGYREAVEVARYCPALRMWPAGGRR